MYVFVKQLWYNNIPKNYINMASKSNIFKISKNISQNNFTKQHIHIKFQI